MNMGVPPENHRFEPKPPRGARVPLGGGGPVGCESAQRAVTERKPPVKRPSRFRDAWRLLAAAILVVPAAAQSVWRVDAGAPPGGNGASWATAFDSLDDALLAAGVDDQIWVAAGVYLPSVEVHPGDPRSAAFAVQAVGLYGGFDGTETSLDERAGLFDQTRLSGDLGAPGDPADNAYHVLCVNNPSGIPAGWTVVDGFDISGGNADGSWNDARYGGGIHCFNSALSLARCTLRENRAWWGGGLHAQPGIVQVKWCTFADNAVTGRGGAIWGMSLGLKVYNSTFARNAASGRGGALYVNSIASSPPGSLPFVVFVNCLLHDNRAARGGAAYVGAGNYGSGKATFSQCTVAYNYAEEAGGGILARTNMPTPAEVRIHNSIVWANRAPKEPQLRGRIAVAWSDVQHPLSSGLGNISADPLFIDPAGRDLRPGAGSPVIDAADNGRVQPDLLDLDGDGKLMERTPVDLAGRRRFLDDPAVPNTGVGGARVVDMGAYER